METFIHQQYIPDISICDDLIAAFNASHYKRPGLSGGDGIVDLNIKDSIDVTNSDLDFGLIEAYCKQLQVVIDGYTEKYPYSAVEEKMVVNGQVQCYPPGGGYKLFHSERGSIVSPAWFRHLVFMTYLNDVTDQGETEFFYQKMLIKPRKGLTLIWPVEWTHVHRGIVSPTQTKYIITGWLSHVLPSKQP